MKVLAPSAVLAARLDSALRHIDYPRGTITAKCALRFGAAGTMLGQCEEGR
jgi:hypothetical protein